MSRILRSSHREILERLADVVIPRTAGMPSASDIGLVGMPVEHVLRSRPDLASPLCLLLDSLGDEAPERFVSRLAVANPKAFSVLMQTVAGAYYMDQSVRRRIGYPGQEAIELGDIGHEVEILTAKIAASPARYRPAPAAESSTSSTTK